MTLETATRGYAFQKLERFLPFAGTSYGRDRNFDRGPENRSNTSTLSPYLQRRLIAESEVLAAVLARFSRAECDKFTQEVLWRSYWKCWLERRPSVWGDYLQSLARLGNEYGDISFPKESGFARALAGNTGIEPFDAWRSELKNTGFLHNHARMWFASIWIFTLRLPWQLGAALFLSELLDADAAANTLSWKWVAGLHTKGKGYVATSSNIAKFTDGKYNPVGQLNESPILPDFTEVFPLVPIPSGFEVRPPPEGRIGLIMTGDDLSLEATDLGRQLFSAIAFVPPSISAEARYASELVRKFEAKAMLDGSGRAREHFGCKDVTPLLDTGALASWIFSERLDAVVGVRPWTGFVRTIWDQLVESCPVVFWEGMRAYDLSLLPEATRGYFPFRETLPAVLDRVTAERESAPRVLLRESGRIAR